MASHVGLAFVCRIVRVATSRQSTSKVVNSGIFGADGNLQIQSVDAYP